MNDFFISHSSTTKELARLVYYNALANGFFPWYDEGLLNLGDDLSAAIERGIKSSAAYVLLHNKAASQSRWVQLEMTLAERRHRADPSYRLLVVKLDSEPLPPFWGTFRYLRVQRVLRRRLDSSTTSPKPFHCRDSPVESSP
jgi:hypothetical protein